MPPIYSKDLNPDRSPQGWGVDIGSWTTNDLTDHCKQYKCGECVSPCIRSNHPVKQCVAGYWDLGKNEMKYEISNGPEICFQNGASKTRIQEKMGSAPLPLNSEIVSEVIDAPMGIAMKILILTCAGILTSIVENIAYANVPFYRHKFKKLKRKLVGRRERKKEKIRADRRQFEENVAASVTQRLTRYIHVPAGSSGSSGSSVGDGSETYESISHTYDLPSSYNVGARRPSVRRSSSRGRQEVRPISHV